jgi:phosphate transport system substrate-binding protein
VYFTVTDLAKVYTERNPQSAVVADYTDHHSLLPTIAERKSDAIMVLGKLEDDMKEKASENGIRLEEHVVGWGAIVLGTSPDNPVDELTLEQVRKIFVGEYQNWKEVGGLDEPIVTMSRDDAVSGTDKFFREFVLKGFPFKQQTVRLFDADIATAVWKRKGSIADDRYTEAIRGRIRGMVKIIAIKEDENSQAIMPSVDSLRSKFYPMSAPMFVYYGAKSHTGDLKDFVDFCARRGLGANHSQLIR